MLPVRLLLPTLLLYLVCNMAVGAAFYKWAAAGLAISMAVPDISDRRPAESVGVEATLPWNRAIIDDRLRGADWRVARGMAQQSLIKAQSANRRRKAGAPSGPIDHNDLDISYRYSNIDRSDCYISNDNRTACFVDVGEAFQPGLVAMHINRLFGNNIAGIYNGSSIVSPSGATNTLPSGIVAATGNLIIVLEN